MDGRFASSLRRWASTAVAVAFGFGLLRTLFAALDFRFVDALGRDPLAAAALAVGVGLAGLVPYLWRRSYVPTAALVLLIAARLVVQASGSADADLWWSMLGVAAFSAFLAGVSGSRSFPIAVLLGVVFDRTLLGLLGTVDLVWRTGPLPIIVVVALGGVALLTYRRASAHPEACASLGLWVALELLMFGNPGFVASVTGWELRWATLLVGFGGVAAVGAAVLWSRRPAGWRPGMTALGFAALAGIVPLVSGAVAAVILVVASALAGAMLVDLRSERRSGAMWLVAMIVTLFAVYAPFQYPLGYRWAAVPFVAALAVAAGTRSAPRAEALGGRLPVAVAAVVALPLLFVVGQAPPPALLPNGGIDELNVMTYNLHQGFAVDGSFSLPELADVIEASGADVVALQEVQRGWVTDGEVDMASWLSRRLGMPFVTGPTADRQWGNLLLSRYPIVSATNPSLPPDDLTLRRGYIDAEIDLGTTRVRVIVTHLHHVDADDDIRAVQARAIVETLAARPTIVAGDLNAEPGDDAILILRQAGLVDAGAGDDLPTSPADQPTRRIDYILVSPDLAVDEVSVVASTASDHLPVIARLRLPEG